MRYIDYNTDWLPEGNSFYPFMHKRKSFEHEREARALIQDIDATIDSLVAGKANNSTGQLVPIEVNDLISAIHIAPNSPSWLVDLVTEVASKYEISADVRRSDLYSEPVFQEQLFSVLSCMAYRGISCGVIQLCMRLFNIIEYSCNPLEWTGHLQPTAEPPQALYLPLRGSVGKMQTAESP
ncbi:MAG: hypothetical protein ACK55E_00360 [Cyanobacteriota bacterium]